VFDDPKSVLDVSHRVNPKLVEYSRSIHRSAGREDD
jgi:hypothetical protein